MRFGALKMSLSPKIKFTLFAICAALLLGFGAYKKQGEISAFKERQNQIQSLENKEIRGFSSREFSSFENTQPNFSSREFSTFKNDSKTAADNEKIHTESQDFSYFNANFVPKSSLIKPPTKSAHSSTLAMTSRGLMALFFAGSREGARDVRIFQSFYDSAKNEWSEPESILNARALSKMSGKFIKKLGNPVAFQGVNGKVHFFVVGVSLGGWATSRVYQLEFDENLRPKFKGELGLGAFANLSHLVRNPAASLKNGAFVLPLYHELAKKYALLGFFDENANLLYTRRINSLKNQLQPSLIIDGAECLAFFRNHKAHNNTAFLQKCSQNGEFWDTPTPTNLKNYDSSSVLCIIFVNGKSEILLAHNDGKDDFAGENANSAVSNADISSKSANQNAHPRSKLSLFWLKDKEKGEFIRLFSIDEGGEVSYPSIYAHSNGGNALENGLYISYTLDRRAIKMKFFSADAVKMAIEAKRGEK